MVQFYFLSIFVNFIGGLLLAGDVINKQFPNLDTLKELFKSSTYMLIFGIVAAVAGLFKIISVFSGDVPIIGDLLPAAASLSIAVHLFSNYFYDKSGVLDGKLEKVNTFIDKYKNIIGITAIIIAILHFFFPNVLFI